MKPTVDEIVCQLSELSKQLSEQRGDLLKLDTSIFIRAFVDLTGAIESLDTTRELLLGRAETLLSRPRETERKLRKEHLKLVPNRK